MIPEIDGVRSATDELTLPLAFTATTEISSALTGLSRSSESGIVSLCPIKTAACDRRHSCKAPRAISSVCSGFAANCCLTEVQRSIKELSWSISPISLKSWAIVSTSADKPDLSEFANAASSCSKYPSTSVSNSIFPISSSSGANSGAIISSCCGSPRR